MNIFFDKREQIAAINGDALLADGFEAALIGYTNGDFGDVVAVYDHAKCIEILMEDGLTEEDAIEHMSFNVTGGYVGPGTPIWIHIFKEEEE